MWGAHSKSKESTVNVSVGVAQKKDYEWASNELSITNNVMGIWVVSASPAKDIRKREAHKAGPVGCF